MIFVKRALFVLSVVAVLLGQTDLVRAEYGSGSGASDGQGEASTPSGDDALRVFLDCGSCDRDFLRREILFVNYVRDRPDAQVHVLVTVEGTGGGGAAWTLDFYGLEEFAGLDDQLMFYTSQDDTDDSRRRALARTLSLG